MLNPIVLILKGFVLGISMVLPGVSGGTMAFIMGIYEKLIGEISKMRIRHIKKLLLCLSFRKAQIKQSILFFWTTWDWAFLIPVGFGIVCSGILFIAFASPVIEKYSLEFYSIIFGLVLASVFKPFKEMKKSKKTFILFFASFSVNTLCFVFGSNFLLFPGEPMALIFLPVGFVISTALIIPGISGSYLLLIFGLYEKTLQALKQGELFVICFFLFGVVLGVFSVAKLIQRMIQNYFNETMAVILGLILGSLYAVYPLPKESLGDLLLFDTQKKIFLFYFVISCFIFMILSLFYEKEVKSNKVSRSYTGHV